MKPGEIREKTNNELLKMSTDLENEIFQLRFRMGTGQLKSTSDLKKKRRDLARVKTILKQKETGAVKQKA